MTTSGDTDFSGSIPEIYERMLVPLIFAEPASLMTETIVALAPHDVLETCAGTGALTRDLDAVGTMTITATDLNPAMVQIAETQDYSDRVTWQVADATDLPFADASFDLVACQFGAMFFPDKTQGFAEAHRALRPGGTFVFNVWDRIEANDISLIVTDVVSGAVGGHDLQFLRRTPHGYHDADAIRSDLEAAGFSGIEVAHCTGTTTCTAADGATAYCQGSPLRSEIEQHPDLTLEQATAIAQNALELRYGPETFEAQTGWLQITAVA